MRVQHTRATVAGMFVEKRKTSLAVPAICERVTISAVRRPTLLPQILPQI